MTGIAIASNSQPRTTNPALLSVERSVSARSTGQSQFSHSMILSLTCLGCALFFLSKPSLASETVAIQSPPSISNLQPDQTPLDLTALQSGKSSESVVTSTSLNRDGMVMPSLWWMRDQFADQAKYGQHFVKNWLVQPIQTQQPGRVDLIVDQQKWSQLDYLDRYEFITGFGIDSHRYGYNLRIFDERGRSLGASTCDFSQISSVLAEHAMDRAERPSTVSNVPLETTESERSLFPLDLGQLTCRIALSASGKGMVRGRP